jgi:hypothetical protein
MEGRATGPGVRRDLSWTWEPIGKFPTEIRHSLMDALRRVAFAHRMKRVDLWRFPSRGAFDHWSPRAVWDDGS